MKTVIVCYYCDLGRPYLPLIERMTASAKRVMPDVETILLTPKPDNPAAKFFDDAMVTHQETTADNLCLERGRAISSWVINGPKCRTIFVDPDLVFQSEVQFDSSFDVGLLWRKRKPDQRINTGMILSNTPRPDFWMHYGRILVNLPLAIHHWWCDQIAFSILAGACHAPGDHILLDDARVWLMEGERYCPVIGEETPEAWAVHYKGKRKGEGWEEVYRREAEPCAA